MDDRDIWTTANLMIKRFGDDAVVEAAMRADELAGEGNSAGASIWKRIKRAIEQLVEAPSGPPH